MKRIFLLQIRQNKKITDHELDCFKSALSRGDNKKTELSNQNVYDSHFSLQKIFDNHDAFMVGGSSHNPDDNFPNRELVDEFLNIVTRSEKPFLSICYGFELLVAAFDEKMTKVGADRVGTYKLELTTQGLDDPLFAGCPKTFFVQEAHRWSVDLLPGEFDVLAKSSAVPFQAIRLRSNNTYGVQFHPELDDISMKHRMELHRGGGFIEGEHHNLEYFYPSSDAWKIVSNFANNC